MAKKVIIFAVLPMVVLIGTLVIVKRRESNVNESIDQLLAQNGTPTLLAKWFEIDKHNLRVLRILVLSEDPQTVTNWNAVTNTFFIWADSEPAKRNARYFYEEMKGDKTFDGKGWYSSRSLYGGEKVTIAKIEAGGKSSAKDVFKVDAFSFQLMGFKPRTGATDNEQK